MRSFLARASVSLCLLVRRVGGLHDCSLADSAKAQRLPMQAWEQWPMCLPAWIWTMVLVLDQQVACMTVLDHIVRHLCRLGLKTPSEQSQAVFARSKRAEGPIEDPQSLRVLLLNIKSQLQSNLGRLKGSGVLEEGAHLSRSTRSSSWPFRRMACPSSPELPWMK